MWPIRGLVVKHSGALTLDGVISGSGDFEQAGAGTTLFAADNTYTGMTTISGGTLQLGNGGDSGSIKGDITNNGRLTFKRAGSHIFSGTISGSGSITQAGSGTTVLTADSTYSGNTTISAGTLQLGHGGWSGSITGDVVNNGTFAFDRSDPLHRPSTYACAISGSGTIA